MMKKEPELKPCPFCGGPVDYMTLITGVKMFYCRSYQKCGAVVSFNNPACNPRSKIRDSANAYHWNERAGKP